MVWDSSVPEHNDKIDSVNFYKDNFLFLKSFGPQKYQRFPVKGIDGQGTELGGPLMDFVEITNVIGGATNETAGGYSCQVDYTDYHVPEHDDKIDSVNFYKDNFLFLKSFGPRKYQRFPVKGIDSQETEVGPLMDYVVITNYIVGANNETAGGYSCQVDYIDYHGYPGNITAATKQLKLK
ncbi:unnamed protein product [Oppiella nova]|uniref:Uncharacterized protein n=1 Tax=Oppiella nova TaxID=334625 RepID=A0A7R9QRQ6_9ACAR|nr:unnamed protein product [Oppiella nova]CAG2172547.1 unnamed protein product [Oppiella nova]